MDDGASMVGDMSRMRSREGMFERRGISHYGNVVDENMGNIKMSILPFKGRSDHEAYLE